ncbi:MAG: GFA family protein [Hyphomicrobiales bacterium]
MASKPMPIIGGCLCKAVRYEASGPPSKGAYCHCDLCKKSYGGLFMAGLGFKASEFQFVQGTLKYHRSSDIAQRGCCADCGSPLVFVFDGDDEVWMLLGSLDDPEAWPLTKDATWGLIAHTQTARKISWYALSDGVQQWAGAPFQEEALARASEHKP